MSKVLYYLYDPLCGWCYGATRSVSRLLAAPGLRIEPLPSGLFSGGGARPMSDDFAAFAWANDQRIARMTGQPFTEDYRRRVLGDRQRPLDSGPATLALTAVALTAPAREFETLKAIQHARYVDGGDVTSRSRLAALLQGLGLEAASARIGHPDADLLDANRARIGRARSLMQALGASGVPAFIVESGTKREMLDSSTAYAMPDALVEQLQTA